MIEDEIRPVVDALHRVHSATHPVVVGVDGRSGTGKSTLSRAIANATNGAHVDQDDFYSGGGLSDWLPLSPELRCQRCIDWQRVRLELLRPLRSSQTARYYPFDWETMAGLSAVEVRIDPVDVVVLDGTYSTRPELLNLIDLTVLVTLDESARRHRQREREGADWDPDWSSMWDAAEDVYFETVRPESSFDIVICR